MSSSCCTHTCRKPSWIAPHFTELQVPEQSWWLAIFLLQFFVLSSFTHWTISLIGQITLECLLGTEGLTVRLLSFPPTQGSLHY